MKILTMAGIAVAPAADIPTLPANAVNEISSYTCCVLKIKGDGICNAIDSTILLVPLGILKNALCVPVPGFVPSFLW